MKREDTIRLALFLLALVLVLALVYVVTLPLPLGDSATEITRLKAQVSALEEKMEALRGNFSEASDLYSKCQSELERCLPAQAECTNKDLNFNAICKKLGLGTMLRVNADREADIVFQCITETKTTYLFYSRTENNIIKILDSSYNEVLNITDCEI